MTFRFATARTFGALCLSAALVLPSSSAAQTGGTSASGGGTAPAPSTAPAPAATGLVAGPRAYLYRLQRASGTVPGATAGEVVVLQRSDTLAGWITVARATAAANGSFSVLWRATRAGRFVLRAVREAEATGATAASTTAPPPSAPVTVYGLGKATYYGPGLYGNRTACGSVLTPTTVGVAHRTLPCGTRIEFYYAGRTVTVPVIDRGPFVRGVYWDLTAAVARSLRFPGTAFIGGIAVGRGPVPAR